MHKRMRFLMFNQIKIINYFKSVDQSFKSFKFSAFINCFCSTFGVYFSVNRTAETSQYQQIAIDETFDLKNQQKIKNCFSLNEFRQKYIVVADLYHTNKNIRLETSLTNARKYNSVKSSNKSIEKFKFSIFNSRFNSTSRFRFSFN